MFLSQEQCREMLRLEGTSGPLLKQSQSKFAQCCSQLGFVVIFNLSGKPGHPHSKRSVSLCSDGFQSVPISSFSVNGATENSVAPSLFPPFVQCF